VIDGWDIAEANTSGSASDDFCHWHVPGDEVHLAIGAAHGYLNKQLSSIALQANHAAHTKHDLPVKSLFRHVNESLWSSSADGDTASLFHARLDPTCGSLQYGLVGGVFAYVLRPHGWEPLFAESRVLGADDEFHVEVRNQMLIPGDILLAMSGPDASRQFERDNLMNQVAEQLLLHTHLAAKALAELAAQAMRTTFGPESKLAILVAKRSEV
jgi:hypothetical protein